MQQTLEVTISATIVRTITVEAWDVSEAEEDAIELFEAGISGQYDLHDIEIVEVNMGGVEDND